MNLSPYSQALAQLRAREAHYLKEVGDQWRTPDLLFWGVNAMFGPLVLDLFADDSNAKCPAWYTAEDNALTQDWSGRLAELGGAAFANPPYSRSQYHKKQAITGMTHIMKYTAEQREKGGRYIYLVEWLVTIYGVKYQIIDIGMRMLQPHELYRAQGFPADYIIDRDYRGNRYAKDKQVARCGNAVPPPFAEALVRANLPEMCIPEQREVA